MPIEDQIALTPNKDKSTADIIGGDLDAFFGDAASVARNRLANQEAEKQSERPEIRSELTETGTTRIIVNDRGRKVIHGLVSSAAGLGVVIAGVTGIAANNAQMESSKVVVGTSSFMPSPETGETWGQADATVDTILENNNIDPNKISYQEVGNALSPALDQEKEVTEGPLTPGASFNTTVYEQIDLFGGKHYSVDIDSSKYLAQQDTDKEK